MKTREKFALIGALIAHPLLAQLPLGPAVAVPPVSIGVGLDLSEFGFSGVPDRMSQDQAWNVISGIPFGLYNAGGQAPLAKLFLTVPLSPKFSVNSAVGYAEYRMTSVLRRYQSCISLIAHDIIMHVNEVEWSSLELKSRFATVSVAMGWTLPIDRAVVMVGLDASILLGASATTADIQFDTTDRKNVIGSSTRAWQPPINRVSIGLALGLRVPVMRVGPFEIDPDVSVALPITNIISSARVGASRISTGISLRLPLGTEPRDEDEEAER